MEDVKRERVTGGDPQVRFVEHQNGEFSIEIQSDDSALVRRVSKAEAVRMALFITQRR